MNDGEIAYSAAQGVGRLVISQPSKRNAVTYEMWRGLPALMRAAEGDPSTRVIVLEGAGERAFSSGADISQFGERRSAGERAREYEAAVAEAMQAVTSAGKPTVAIIRGLAFGGGLALAMCCHVRLASREAQFRIPAARLGIGYAFCAVETLVARVGLTAAADLLLTARVIDGAEAERIGALTKAWPPDAFEDAAWRYVQAIASNAPLTLAALKQALNECLKPPDQRDRAQMDELAHACMNSADYLEGQAAFRDRREPTFRGA